MEKHKDDRLLAVLASLGVFCLLLMLSYRVALWLDVKALTLPVGLVFIGITLLFGIGFYGLARKVLR